MLIDNVTDSVDAQTSIEALLHPSHIAIAGASSDPGKIGSLPLAFLLKHGYRGRISPIHPKLATIDGIRCFASLRDIEGDIDLLVVAIAAARISGLFDECRPGQVKAAVILSSGFAETGKAGSELQDEIKEKALAKGIRFIGPNSVGIANLREGVVPSISQVFDQAELRPGPVAFVSQSGAVGTAITALAHREGIGIGCFVSTGNEGDLEFSDLCDYFADDPSIGIIAGYLESIRDGDKFRAAAAKAIAAGKPVVLIKVGASEAGSRAVRSHTGALAGSEEVYRAVFAELGVIRVHGVEELIDVLKVLSLGRRHTSAADRAPRVAILSHSGGAGVLMADKSIAEGLEVPAPSAALLDALKRRLPTYASFDNPIDMTANVVFDAPLMVNTLRDVIRSREYDAVMLCVNLIWRHGSALAEQLSLLADEADALVAIAWIAAKEEPLEVLSRSGIPVFPDPVRCVKAVVTALRWQARRGVVPTRGPRSALPSNNRGCGELLGYRSQARLLQNYGIKLARWELVTDVAGACAAAGDMGYPVVAKLAASRLAHKSDIGGVHINIESEEQLVACFRALESIPIADREGVLVQKMLGAPLEIFVGMKRDQVFGPVMVVGLGGIYVEIIRDTVMRLAPFDEQEATELLAGAKFFPLLSGARGRPKLDVGALAKIVAAVSQLARSETEIVSLDLNPVMVTETGAQVVDFKIECAE
jgi:acetate---CoA ligase (ADP-forming)